MIKLFFKFYFLTLIFFVSLVKILLVEPLYLICVFTFPLLPQSLLNFGTRHSKSPSFLFLTLSTMLHLSFPAYFLVCKSNFY